MFDSKIDYLSMFATNKCVILTVNLLLYDNLNDRNIGVFWVNS